MKPVSGTNLEQAKAHNRRVVIETIRAHGPMTRSDLARRTALTVQTISNIVAELVSARMLMAGAPRVLPRGQPVTPYSIDPDGAYSIGLELERDHAAGVLTDLSGAVRARLERPADRPGPDAALPLLGTIVDDLVSMAGIDRARLLGAGIAMPGRYREEGIASLTPAALPGWQGFPIAARLGERLGMPVLVENDASAAAIGERLYGAGRGLSDFAYIWIGLGVSSALVIDGRLHRGRHGNAGEIHHLVTVPDGRACACGKRGCLGAYLALGNLHDGVGSAEEEAVLRAIAEDHPAIDAWALAAAEPLRQVIDAYELAFDPATVVIGGSLPPQLLSRLLEALEPLHPPVDPEAVRDLPRVTRGSAGRYTSLLGAAALPVFSETNPQFDVLQKPVA